MPLRLAGEPRAVAKRKALEGIGVQNMMVYNPTAKKDAVHTVTVFTDIDCGLSTDDFRCNSRKLADILQ